MDDDVTATTGTDAEEDPHAPLGRNWGGKRPGAGRPPAFKPEYAAQATKLYAGGFTDFEVGEFFEVSERTVYNWAHHYPEFAAAQKLGKDAADNRVEQALFSRAVGYKFQATKIMSHEGVAFTKDYIEHVPPDVNACMHWLKNRRPDQWREKVALEFAGGAVNLYLPHNGREAMPEVAPAPPADTPTGQ